MNKILEFKSDDFMKGISAQPNVAKGGLFQTIYNYDPFEQGGVLLPSLTPAAQGLSTLSKFLTSWDDGAGTQYLYGLGTTKLYRILKNSPYTVSDQTAQINQHLTFGTAANHIGHTIWKGKYIYATVTSTNNGCIMANALPVASGSDVLIQSAFNERTLITFCVGADLNLYFNWQDNVIGVITDATTTNTTIYKIDDGFKIRHMINDGRYLVILADTNASVATSRVTGDYKCRVYFWDMKNVDTNNYIDCSGGAKYEFSDSYLIGGAYLDGGIYFFGYNGLYLCNVATFPHMIRPFTSNTLKMGRPTNPYQIAAKNGSLYWLDGTTSVNHYVYAYGNPITGQQKIFYIPYDTTVTAVSQALLAADNIIVANDIPSLYFFSTGSTRGTLTFSSLSTLLPQPYTYGYAKVVLQQNMAAAQSVEVVTTTKNAVSTISDETKSYSAANAKQTHKFDRTIIGSNQPTKMEDITLSLVSVGAGIQRVCVYGSPLEDANTDL